MSLERMPNGRKKETYGEVEECSRCRGKGTVGDSPNNVRMCPTCNGTGKVRSR